MRKRTFGLSMDELYRRAVRRARPALAYADTGRSLGLLPWQRRLRGRLLELLQIDGRPKSPPRVRFVERVACDGYVRHKAVLFAADGLGVPFYLLEPHPRPPHKLGVCLAIHGHGPGKVVPAAVILDDETRRLIREGQRDYGVQAAREGFLAIVPDLRGMGELKLSQDVGAPRGGCWQPFLRSAQLGRCLLGQRVADALQLLDWALARPDVDPRRVVMTGNSGGGTMTLFTAAVDRRIAACAPSCYFSTFAGSILAMWHCPCNFVPGIQEVAEMSDLGGLFAPRPMLVIAGRQDPIFPLPAVRKGFRDLARIYTDAGARRNLELYVGEGAHRYYSARVWEFFREKLPPPQSPAKLTAGRSSRTCRR